MIKHNKAAAGEALYADFLAGGSAFIRGGPTLGTWNDLVNLSDHDIYAAISVAREAGPSATSRYPTPRG